MARAAASYLFPVGAESLPVRAVATVPACLWGEANLVGGQRREPGETGGGPAGPSDDKLPGFL